MQFGDKYDTILTISMFYIVVFHLFIDRRHCYLMLLINLLTYNLPIFTHQNIGAEGIRTQIDSTQSDCVSHSTIELLSNQYFVFDMWLPCEILLR